MPSRDLFLPIVFLLALLVACTDARSNVALWDVSTANPFVGSTFAVTTTNGIQSASSLTFAGVTAVNNAGWQFSNWPNSTTKGGGQYISFSFSPIPGQPVQLQRVDFNFNISVNPVGPKSWELDVSTDSTFATVTQTQPFTISTGLNQQQQVNINPAITANNPIFFRLYGFGLDGSTTGGTGGLVSTNGGGGTNVGVVIEGTVQVLTCSCVGSTCAGQSHIYNQGDCVNILNPCTGAPSSVFGRISTPSANNWTIAEFSDVNCTTSTRSVSSTCGSCDSLSILFPCAATCPTSGSGAGSITGMLHEVFPWLL